VRCAVRKKRDQAHSRPSPTVPFGVLDTLDLVTLRGRYLEALTVYPNTQRICN